MPNYKLFVILFAVNLFKSALTANINSNSQNILHNLDLPAVEAENLCKEVKKSLVQNDDLFLWTKVHSVEESEQQNTFQPGCYSVKYARCAGASRYPVDKSCGFFFLTKNKACSSKNEESPLFKPVQPVYLTHSQVSHICLSVQDLPTDSPFKVNFIPIKINLTPVPNPTHLTEDCLRWVYHPCGLTPENVDGKSCDKWIMDIHSDAKCSQFHTVLKLNYTRFEQDIPSPFSRKTDFVEGEELDEETLLSSTDLLQQIVKCSSDRNGVSCHVLPAPEGGRVKRSEKSLQTPITRVKRQCCSLYRCGRCGSSRRLPRFYDCNCSSRPDNLCETQRLCDLHELNGQCGVCCGLNCAPGSFYG